MRPMVHPSWLTEPVFTQEQRDTEDDQEYWDYTPYWLTINTDDQEEPDLFGRAPKAERLSEI